MPDGGLLVGSADPWLAVLDAAGAPRWVQRPPQADLRDQVRTLRVSADGGVVDFGYEVGGKAPARFDLARLALTLDPPADGQTRPPEQATLKVEHWENSHRPTLNGTPLALKPYELSRSLAIAPGRSALRPRHRLVAPRLRRRRHAALDATGPRCRLGHQYHGRRPPGGRRLLAMGRSAGTAWTDGREVLALFPLADRRNWVAWTPEGVYAATPGAHGVLRWHVNRGWDAPAEAIPVSEIPETLPTRGHPPRAPDAGHPPCHRLGGSSLKMRAEVQRRTGAAVAPGARLHVLTVGVSDYGQAATHLKLNFAAADATDVAAALLTTQTGLYAEVRPQRLSNQDATRAGILRGLATMRQAMARGEPGRDLAVVHFSGHGTLLDGEFYLLPHDVDVRRPGGHQSDGAVGVRCSARSSKAWPSTAGCWCCWMPAARAGRWRRARPWRPMPHGCARRWWGRTSRCSRRRPPPSCPARTPHGATGPSPRSCWRR